MAPSLHPWGTQNAHAFPASPCFYPWSVADTATFTQLCLGLMVQTAKLSSGSNPHPCSPARARSCREGAGQPASL